MIAHFKKSSSTEQTEHKKLTSHLDGLYGSYKITKVLRGNALDRLIVKYNDILIDHFKIFNLTECTFKIPLRLH